eukprot:3932742-Rhodomonas_salina.1
MDQPTPNESGTISPKTPHSSSNSVIKQGTMSADAGSIRTSAPRRMGSHDSMSMSMRGELMGSLAEVKRDLLRSPCLLLDPFVVYCVSAGLN